VKIRFTERADKDYATLLPEVRKAFAKQLGFLLNQLAHPSPARQEIRRRERYLASPGESQLAILFCDPRG
jgi:mRNA-degrading endonuclease RelE of RelBE toxin-antitoxin system